ncbi:DNA repair protein RadA [Paramuribaculum intestinale]|uniref:DNA repair protein RadA n=4 Tax=Paramuribaculum intestinale TaxID=2094151 RepID=A0A2V1J2X9_9BACT|nr:DNA repair protein RadA [Paramuribaculum intestinale]MBJ2185356.1 DNA repair protein RadA [Muribaculaceae bacterium]ROS94183.1 DNA repair protein RadA [Muribaculaceae bacterium Isolate-043 (Harlan)]ROT13918.1 DNA repair protein RadA [Muribaculaceae bacterium Isolate-105 (HZI)]RXE62292.1 DNA repair protein RadA [Muribaculaceae bacterium Isolate-004 (NCI)]PWB05923.1 DNA repair protein RadA [Paramuribaculum intestinale]
MAKTKTVWVCSSCGNDFPKWEGRCSACGAWNTLVEEKVTISSQTRAKSGMTSRQRPRPLRVSEIETSDAPRIRMPSKELNRVLGGGLVPGSMVLIGGEPGIGKSTLVLQNTLSIQSRRVLYVSGEESAMQIKMRAERLGRQSDTVYIVCDTSLENIFEHIENTDPGLIVIDSIQTIASDELESPAGSVGQVRECSARLLRYAKESGVPVIVIGHITKEGNIAGPKVLEHIVDTVLQFEGDRHYLYRLLRSIKNRFGSTSELGIYEMVRSGLREVTNPSEILLSQTDTNLSGTSIGVTMEGIRPLMIEVQALVSTAAYGTPQRSVTGFDAKRMNMLLAVLEKRVGFKLAQKDVFLNIAGGMKVNDPALDMAVISAILSSNVDIVVPHTVCMAGEVGLTGEIRPVTRIEQRIQEAEKLGMEQIIIPRSNVKGMDLGSLNIKITEVSKVEEAFRLLFA